MSPKLRVLRVNRPEAEQEEKVISARLTMLKEAFTAKFGGKVEFVPDVKPEKYKLFQLADLICTVSLIARKIELGHPMTNSEHKFFGGPRVFMRNILRSIKPKEI